ncbi:DUF1579 domain-containing protein [Flavobacterium sp. W22_SRS_FK3]|uniref:DUF1579 domain-containing protein n=1 Tax=Flavobacterium sp. W22_SRS_FK3 TaxID=3240275 RepID=UPI003F937258
MKNFCLVLSMLVIFFISCKKEVKSEMESGTMADSIKIKEPIAEEPLDSATQMKLWEAYATPGNAHKLMADETGTWKCDMTFWEEPNGKPSYATSTANVKMILGGRYQETKYTGTMMGEPFEGIGTLAFNNASKEYTTTFIDNMGTGMMVATGKYDEKTKIAELKGEMVSPLNGKKTPYREVYTFVDPNNRKMEMYDTKDGKEYKSMEITMTKE